MWSCATCSAAAAASPIGAAFGLELVSTFPVPGLAVNAPAAEGRPQVALTLANPGELAARRGARRVLSEQPLPRGSCTISTGADGGYWLDHAFYGTFHVSGDGSAIECAPNDLPAWVWQRFLIAQPLPLASLLQGYEPLHASAVGLGARAVLLMGTTGAGKSSVALQLTLRGASFLADDVTSLKLSEGIVIAHPGAPLSSVDSHEADRLPRAWERLGSLEGESRIVIADATSEPLPVGAVYVLTRTADAHSIEIVTPASGRAKALLGGTFNAYLRAPARLARQLEISGRVAETARVWQLRIPMDADAGGAADAILRAEAS